MTFLQKILLFKTIYFEPWALEEIPKNLDLSGFRFNVVLQNLCILPANHL